MQRVGFQADWRNVSRAQLQSMALGYGNISLTCGVTWLLVHGTKRQTAGAHLRLGICQTDIIKRQKGKGAWDIDKQIIKMLGLGI